MDPKYTDCVAAARNLVDPALLDSLKKLRSHAVVLATLLIWLQMAFAWWLALFGPLWLVWLPFLATCALSQAMLLWMHEASHFSLHSDRRINDIWCDIFFAGPIGVSVAAYRARHMTHHAHLGTERDEDSYPYRLDVKGSWALTKVLLRTLSGSMGIWLVKDKYLVGARLEPAPGFSPRWLAPAATLAVNFSMLGLCIWSGRWYLYFLLWVYPIIAVAIMLNIVRTIAEHQPGDFAFRQNGDEMSMRPVVRTTVPNCFEKWMMYQANFNYHLEHHIFPAIPQHNLRELHLHLVKKGFYRQFPGSLQKSGFAKFLQLTRHAGSSDYSDAVEDAIES